MKHTLYVLANYKIHVKHCSQLYPSFSPLLRSSNFHVFPLSFNHHPLPIPILFRSLISPDHPPVTTPITPTLHPVLLSLTISSWSLLTRSPIPPYHHSLPTSLHPLPPELSPPYRPSCTAEFFPFIPPHTIYLPKIQNKSLTSTN